MFFQNKFVSSKHFCSRTKSLTKNARCPS